MLAAYHCDGIPSCTVFQPMRFPEVAAETHATVPLRRPGGTTKSASQGKGGNKRAFLPGFVPPVNILEPVMLAISVIGGNINSPAAHVRILDCPSQRIEQPPPDKAARRDGALCGPPRHDPCLGRGMVPF